MKILILNVHSALNLGDQGIMQATLEALRAEFPDAEITVAANHPQSWSNRVDPSPVFEGVTVVGSLTSWVEHLRDGRWKGDLKSMVGYLALLSIAALGYRVFGRRLMWGTVEQRRLLSAYYDADLALSCGGGNFYAYRRFSPFLIWALGALLFAIALGKQVVMLPQSIGPIQGRIQRALARWILNPVRTIMVREPWTQNFLTNDLQVSTRVVLLPDLAFGLAGIVSPKRSPEHPPEIGSTVLDRSAQLRSFGGQSGYEDALCALLTRLAQTHDARITLFCQCYGPSADQDDRPVSARLLARLKAAGVVVTLAPDFARARDLVDAYGKMDLMIGTRMHTSIFAMCSATPVLLIGYQPKGRGVMAMCGLESYCCDIEHLSADILYARASELLDRSAALQAHMLTQGVQIRSRLDGWTRRLL